MKDNHLLKDTVVCISDYSLSRTQMVFDSLDSICYEFDLEKPIWLDSPVKEFKMCIRDSVCSEQKAPFRFLSPLQEEHWRILPHIFRHSQWSYP